MNDQLYQTPQSDVSQPLQGSSEDYGSIEKAIHGDYHFEIGAVMKEAWEKTSGVKGSIIAGIALIYAISFVFSFITSDMALVSTSGFIISIVLQLTLSLILMPMQTGLAMIGVHRSVDRPYSFKMVFKYFGYILPIIIASIVIYIMITLGFILLVLPGIYLAVSYMFTLLLVIEKDMGFWEAMETSRKAITKRWFTFFFFWILMGFIIIISAIPLFVGLIWTLPMACMAFGIIYRNMFGVNEIKV